MKSNITILFLFFFSLLLHSCQLVNKPTSAIETEKNSSAAKVPFLPYSDFDSTEQIGEFIVGTFEDSKGNLWFGTMQKGVARYDGESLVYFTTKEGLAGNTVSHIVEDKDGILWFGTHSGLSKYDGKTFTNFTIEDDLSHNRISNILIDSRENMWIGTWGGVSRFDGEKFSNFPLPTPDVDVPRYQETTNWLTEIMEDQQGNIWFGRSGYGACKYDGKEFTTYTKKDGLYSNCVHAIEEDAAGNIWFGSRVAERDHPDESSRNGAGGLNRFDGKKFTQYPELKGLNNSDVYCIHRDKSDNLWISTTGDGAYKYDGKGFTNFKQEADPTNPNSVAFHGVQSLLEDSKGNIWFGCSGGLFRLDEEGLVNVTKGGPWE